jgi:hypothetical protein
LKIEVPILITGYNRPDLLKRSLEKLAEIGAKNVYIAIDGAKYGNEKDSKLVRECKKLSLEAKRRGNYQSKFAQRNQGCKNGMISAIDWFFEHETSGIILEDDIEFDLRFIEYCQKGLQFYEKDLLIGSLSGFNPIPPFDKVNRIYHRVDAYTTSYPFLWGWATWKNRWDRFYRDLNNWEAFYSKKNLRIAGGKTEEAHWTLRFDNSASNKVDTWDYGWVLACFKNNWKNVIPKENLIMNIGFGENATHTKSFRLVPQITKKNLHIQDFVWPKADLPSKKVDKWIVEKLFYAGNLPSKIKRKLSYLVKFKAQ